MNNYFKINDAVHYYRRRYNTTFLLKAAIDNPNVILVFRNNILVRDEESHYNHLLSNLSWLHKIKRLKLNYNFFKNPKIYTFLKSEIKPLFISIEELEKIKGYNRALVFDNSCFV